MSLTIPVAHDFVCPWCWVALIQVRNLRAEFPVRFEWIGYELWPPELPFPEPTPKPAPNPDRPPTPSRLEFLLHLEDITLPNVERPNRIRTTHAHQAVEFAKLSGQGDRLLESIYEAYWERGEAIHEPATILSLARLLDLDLHALEGAMANRLFRDQVIGFDDDAYASGIYNVPTITIGSIRYAEQPTKVLRQAIRSALSI